MTNAVTITNMTKKYGRKPVFDNLTLSFPSNRVIGLLGENGVGKTTLLRLIADIIKPSAGEILIHGQPISRKTRPQVSFMLAPENFHSFMTIQDAITYHQDFYPDFDTAKASQLCRDFELTPKMPIKKLSKGNKERLCILLCLCRNVPLYLLDEPVAGLDPKLKHESIKAMLAHVGEEQTIIISSHLLRDLQSIFDEIVILKTDGVVTANTDDIRASGKSVEDFCLEVMR
ncbi:MAG: ABC transporter ATP-binding protein [Defluviitaleaceae bacterium]|nr:ABC transporter ATP-binding protein [Defluviitaleaceae bacterium]